MLCTKLCMPDDAGLASHAENGSHYSAKHTFKACRAENETDHASIISLRKKSSICCRKAHDKRR